MHKPGWQTETVPCIDNVDNRILSTSCHATGLDLRCQDTTPFSLLSCDRAASTSRVSSAEVVSSESLRHHFVTTTNPCRDNSNNRNHKPVPVNWCIKSTLATETSTEQMKQQWYWPPDFQKPIFQIVQMRRF